MLDANAVLNGHAMVIHTKLGRTQCCTPNNMVQAALITIPRKPSPWQSPSQVTTTLKPIFEQARLSLQQAQIIEFVFLRPDHATTYAKLAQQFIVSDFEIRRTVDVMVKRSLLRRHGDGRGVSIDWRAHEIRVGYPAWAAWLKMARQARGDA